MAGLYGGPYMAEQANCGANCSRPVWEAQGEPQPKLYPSPSPDPRPNPKPKPKP